MKQIMEPGYLIPLILIVIGLIFISVTVSFELGLIGGATVALVDIALSFWRYFTEIRPGFSERVTENISSEALIPSKGIQDVISELEQLGFTRLGEVATLYKKERGVTWILMNQNSTIHAEVVRGTAGVKFTQFNTIFQDDAILETSCPMGENIDHQRYHSRYEGLEIYQAYELHLNETYRLAGQHGPPRTVKDIQTLIEWDQFYRENYGMIKLHHSMKRRLMNAISLISFIVGFFLIFVARLDSNILSPQIEFILVVNGLFFAIAITGIFQIVKKFI